jgi:hypothetical protein
MGTFHFHEIEHQDYIETHYSKQNIYYFMTNSWQGGVLIPWIDIELKLLYNS